MEKILEQVARVAGAIQITQTNCNPAEWQARPVDGSVIPGVGPTIRDAVVNLAGRVMHSTRNEIAVANVGIQVREEKLAAFEAALKGDQ